MRRLAYAILTLLSSLAAAAAEAPLQPIGQVQPPDAAAAIQRIVDAARAGRSWERLAELCDRFGPRPAGSASYARAAEWALAEMRRDGLVGLRFEPARIPRWQRGDEALVLLAPGGPRPLPVLGLGGSVGTPADGVTAPVVVVRDFGELERLGAKVKDAIVAYNFPLQRDGASSGYGSAVAYRSGGASRAAKQGARAVLVRSITTARDRGPRTGMMAYDADAPQIPAAAIAVEDAEMLQRLQDRGVPIIVRLSLAPRRHDDGQDPNVIGELVGRERPGELVLVGAHLDSWDASCGAHDDASGAVVVIEALRLLKQLDLIPRRTVRAALFAGEELGAWGGRAYVDAHRDDLDRHVAALEADAGAFPPTGFSVHGAPSLGSALEALLPLFQPLGAFVVRSGWSGADIEALAQQGVPTLGLLTDNSRYFEFHHAAVDTPDKVDPAALNDAVAAFAAMTWLLAELPEPLPRGAPR